jgi:CxxC motif-containing protein
VTLREIICIGCPLGCHVMLTLGQDGGITNVSGNQCKEGRKLAIAELQHPERVLTTSVLTEDSRRRLLPVRTDRPVPRHRLPEIIRATANIRVKPPVKVGQEIAHDILGTGANLISTGTL